MSNEHPERNNHGDVPMAVQIEQTLHPQPEWTDCCMIHPGEMRLCRRNSNGFWHVEGVIGTQWGEGMIRPPLPLFKSVAKADNHRQPDELDDPAVAAPNLLVEYRRIVERVIGAVGLLQDARVHLGREQGWLQERIGKFLDGDNLVSSTRLDPRLDKDGPIRNHKWLSKENRWSCQKAAEEMVNEDAIHRQPEEEPPTKAQLRSLCTVIAGAQNDASYLPAGIDRRMYVVEQVWKRIIFMKET